MKIWLKAYRLWIATVLALGTWLLLRTGSFELTLLSCVVNSVYLLWAFGFEEKLKGLRALANLRQKRVKVNIDAVLEAGAQLNRCRVLDISGGGLLAKIDTSTEISEGDRVRLTFEYESMQLILDARVIHKEKKGPQLCGMQFIESNELPLEVLHGGTLH